MRYGDTRGEGPLGRASSTCTHNAVSPYDVQHARGGATGEQNAGGWRCRVILCMICTRSTPPSLARPPFSSRECRATSLQRATHTHTFLQGDFYKGLLADRRVARRRRCQPSILFLAPEMRVGIKSDAGRQLNDIVPILTTLTLPLGSESCGPSHGIVPSWTCRKRSVLRSFRVSVYNLIY